VEAEIFNRGRIGAFINDKIMNQSLIIEYNIECFISSNFPDSIHSVIFSKSNCSIKSLDDFSTIVLCCIAGIYRPKRSKVKTNPGFC